MRLKIHIGEEIRKELKEKEHSIRWLAEKIGHDHSSLSKKIHRSYMDTDLLADISDVLNVSFFLKLHISFDEAKNNQK